MYSPFSHRGLAKRHTPSPHFIDGGAVAQSSVDTTSQIFAQIHKLCISDTIVVSYTPIVSLYLEGYALLEYIPFTEGISKVRNTRFKRLLDSGKHLNLWQTY